MFRRTPVKPEIHRVHVFTQNLRRGNPAAVVKHFKDDVGDMQRLAKLLDLPTTVFVLPPQSKQAQAKLRFFTPTGEIEMCGHGALAATEVLIPRTLKERINIETNESNITLARRSDGLAQLVLPKAKEIPTNFSFDEINQLLGITDPLHINRELPNCIASSGAPLLFLSLKTRAQLFSLKPHREKILEWTVAKNVSGIYIYTKDTILKNTSTFHARCFNPRSNRDFEDVATGHAAGALASIFSDQKNFKGDITIEQGTLLNKESQIIVSVDPGTTEILVGGHLAVRECAIDFEEDTSSRLSM